MVAAATVGVGVLGCRLIASAFACSEFACIIAVNTLDVPAVATVLPDCSCFISSNHSPSVLPPIIGGFLAIGGVGVVGAVAGLA